MLGENLLRFNKDLKLVVADTETEGLHLGKSRPWQCAFVVYHGNAIVDQQDLYPFWPDLNISPGAAIVTRFNYESYKTKAIPPLDARKKWLRYRNDPTYRIVMHNGLGYDSMVDATWARAIGEEPDFTWLERLIDTNCIAKAMKKGIKPDISSPKNFLAFQFRMTSLIEKGLKTNLSALGKEFKIQYDYATVHEGVNDVLLNKEVFDKIKGIVEI